MNESLLLLYRNKCAASGIAIKTKQEIAVTSTLKLPSTACLDEDVRTIDPVNGAGNETQEHDDDNTLFAR